LEHDRQKALSIPQNETIFIDDIKFEANPFQISEAIILLVKRLGSTEEKVRSLESDLTKLTNEYTELEKKYKALEHQS
jgi:hypothetical protein